MTDLRDHRNNFNLIRLAAAFQVLVVHGLNHLEFDGPLVRALKLTPGVPTFFFISGLLIYGSFERTRHAGLGAFFRNRVLRIFPGLWACVIVATLSVWLTGYFADRAIPAGRFAAWVAGQMSVVQFYNPDFMRAYGVGVLNGALWTITVELQFYLLTPVVFYFASRNKFCFWLLFAASVAANLYLRSVDENPTFAIKLLQVTFLPWIYIFMLGALCWNYKEQAAAALSKVPLLLLIVLYIASMNLVGPYVVNASNAINPISVLLLACCVLKLSTARVPLPRGMQAFIGREDLSYGLYLYHMPVLNALIFLAVVPPQRALVALFVVAGALATLSWFLVEKPALLRKR